MKQTYLKYLEGLKDIKELTVLPFQVEKGEIPQWVDALSSRTDDLIKYLQNRDIQCRKFWFPLHTHKPYYLPDNEFPNSTQLVPKAFWLPSSFCLSDNEIAQVCSHIYNFFRED